VGEWPGTREELVEEQLRLAALDAAPWRFEPGPRIGAVFVCFARGGSGPARAGDPAWAAACASRQTVAVAGRAAAPYEAGLLALREGALLEAASARLRNRRTRSSSTRPGATIRAGRGWRCTSAPCWTCRPSASRIARSSPRAGGRRTSAAPGARCSSTASSSATGSALARGRARSRSTPDGGPMPTPPPVSFSRRAECGRPSRSDEPGAGGEKPGQLLSEGYALARSSERRSSMVSASSACLSGR
jgi:hypothetical protein